MSTTPQGEFAPVYIHEGPPEIVLEVAPVDAPRGRYLHHRLRAGGGRPGAVVIATSGDDMLFVEVDRVGVGHNMLELPRGFGEAADADGAASHADVLVRGALRELFEETGIRAGSATVLGTYLLDTAIYPQEVAVVACSVGDRRPVAAPDGEVSGAVWHAVSDVPGLVRSGALRDGHTLSAIAMWLSAD